MMETASGIEIQRSLFIKPRLFEKFPNWKKRDTVQLCLTILEKIRYLHKKNIILGDINPANILIVSPTEVYFVDTDSYQVEDFPCPVGTVNYTAPELQGKNFGTFLRSFENEYFAVATLLFMIMLPGKSPYAQQGGEDPMENIRRMDFAYAYGENTTKMAPDGPWRFIWSNLPFSIKGAFYNTFRIDGENSAEDKRFTADEWHAKFKKYLEWIDSNLLPDEQQYVIFPDRLKKSDKVTYIKCVMCDREVAEDSCTDGICIECLKKGEVVKCAHCGKEFVYTNRQKLRKVKKSTLCPECNEKPYSTENCTVCGKKFTITVGESESYKSKGYSLPRRCPECRRNNAMPSQETSSVYSSETCSVCGTAFNITVRDYEYFTSKGLSLPRRCPECRRNKVTPSYVRRGLCFITTAVTDFMGKSDDCYELALLRNFRDSWLAYEADGEGLISEYYSIAPAIVRQLNASPNKEGVYRTLLRDYISPCVKYIEEGEFLTCKEHYIKMVKFLQRSFENGC
jgi:serine/threonine protein kinase